jgi:hypothetical protein
MTDKERAEIRRHVSDREKLAKAMAAERSAELLAEFERHISAIYKWSDSEVWAKAHAKAQAAAAEAQIVIGRECKRLGIPSTFQPSLHMTGAVAARMPSTSAAPSFAGSPRPRLSASSSRQRSPSSMHT